MTKNVSANPDDLAAVALGMKCLFVAALIFGMALPTALLIWQSLTPDVVIKRAGAGQFVSASTGSSFLQPSTTTVTTTQGSLIVVGLISAPRNQPLEVVQRSQKSGLELCAVGRSDTCLPMAGAWAGTLQPTRAQAFDFQKHGLDSDHLKLWLLVGFGLSLMTGTGWFSADREAKNQNCEPRESPAIKGPGT
jgi:hypothetical protein